MTGEDFIDFARKMIVMHRSSPAGMRSVASRSYYGVFHVARAFMEDLGFHSPKDESSHRFLLVHLANAEEDNATDIAAHICRHEPVRTNIRDGIAGYRLKISHSRGD